MPAAKYNLLIEQGADFYWCIYWKNPDGSYVPLDNTTVNMDIREHKEDTTPIDQLSTSGGEITVTPAQGKIEVEIPAADTDDYNFITAFYDLEVTFTVGGEKVRLLEGIITLSKEVTR